MVNECQTSPQLCIISNAHIILHVSQVASVQDACPSTIVQGTCGLLPVAISLYKLIYCMMGKKSIYMAYQD